ncbi:MAG: protein-L-isoaspartate(D-aspartate) O-methyltransferase [Rhodothermales bacterium]
MSGLLPLPEDRKFRGRRKRLVQLLREKGITDEAVLEAIGRVKRHRLVESAWHHRAYKDEALPLGDRQTISQPFTVASQSALLDVKPGDRVLEIGTGSGYQAAVLCEMGVTVYSIERVEPLLAQTLARLDALDYLGHGPGKVWARFGDGTLGWPDQAPFDAIVVTAGALGIPDALRQQLRLPTANTPGGRLVIPVGNADGQRMLRLTRAGTTAFEEEQLGSFAFVPLVGRASGARFRDA